MKTAYLAFAIILAFSTATLSTGADAQAEKAPATTQQQPAQEAVPAKDAAQTPPAAAKEFTDVQIQSYATSALEIGDLITKMQPEIEKASTQEQRDDLVSKLNGGMMEIVNKNGGITVADYNAMSDQVRNDQGLADKIIAAMKAKKEAAQP